MDKNNFLLEEFEKKKSLFDSCEQSMVKLILQILDTKSVNYHSVTGRVKEKEKIEEKIIRKEEKYNSIHEITDIIGIRIITYFEDEVDLVAEIIKKEFAIDSANSIDKRIVDSDRFGYRSLHYVVTLNENRTSLLEYSAFKNLKIEIQFRSILQHSWAEIEHDLGYKGEFQIPNIARRSFSRLAALLETVDIEFVRLKALIKEYEQSLTKDIETQSESINIDKASIQAFFNHSQIADEIMQEFIKYPKFLTQKKIVPYELDSQLIQRLFNNGIKTIHDLDFTLRKYRDEIIADFKYRNTDMPIHGISYMAIVFCLLSFLHQNNINVIKF